MDDKLLAFDINKARTDNNPDGLEVVTRIGLKARIVSILNNNSFKPILAIITLGSGTEISHEFCKNGKRWCGGDIEDPTDLFLRKPSKERLMTNRELSKWLRECPEECREVTNNTGYVFYSYGYVEDKANELVKDDIRIRTNYGEWMKPMIEI